MLLENTVGFLKEPLNLQRSKEEPAIDKKKSLKKTYLKRKKDKPRGMEKASSGGGGHAKKDVRL